MNGDPIRSLLFLLPTLLLGPSLTAQVPEPPPRAEALPSQAPGESFPIPRPSHARVHFDAPEEGALWALGRHWKMGFGPRGAVYHAAFRFDLPSLELPLSPDSVTLGGIPLEFGAPRDVRSLGERVELERGAFVEAYDLALESVEQSFVFDTLPRRGELVVRIPVPGVRGADSTEGGLELHTDLGSVRYGHAVAIDARAERIAAPTTFEGGAIVIRVPAAFVHRSTLPLVIDPLVSHVWLDLTSTDCRNPDVVYDPLNDLWMAVIQERFSASDDDVRVVAIGPLGFVTWQGYIDLSGDTWSKPRIAYMRTDTRSLVVAEVGPQLSRIVRGRTVRPNGTLWEFGPPITISDSQPGEKFAPTVGGDPILGLPAYFCVAFQRERPGLVPDFEIQYALVNGVSQIELGPTSIPTAGSLRDIEPSLSRSNGGQRWTLAFRGVEPFNQSVIHAGYITWVGALSPTFPVTTFGVPRDSLPSASSPLLDTSRSAIAFQRRSGIVGQADILVALLEDGAVIDMVNLTALEDAGTQSLDQTEPTIDSDGRHFLVAYAEAFASNPDSYSIWTSQVFPYGDELGVSQAHQELFAFGNLLRVPRVAASRSVPDGPNDFTVVYELRFSPSDHDVGAGRWRTVPGGSWTPYCFGDGSGTACPCGNGGAPGHGCGNSQYAVGARLEVSAGAVSTLNDTAVLRASRLPLDTPCLFFQGTTQLAGVVFGEGLRCAGGFVTRLGVKLAVGSDAFYPAPGDPSLSVRGAVPLEGALRTYQVWYRDSSPYCGTSNYNFTNGVRVLWAH